MKRRGPSNVFTIPKWMTNLRVKEPEGTMTPDQVAASLEMNILFNDGNREKLISGILSLVPKVPLKNQSFMRDLLKGDVLANVQSLIRKSNEQLALLPKEAPIEPRKQELPAQPCGHSDPDRGGEWNDDWDRSSEPKPRSRGQRALRAAKRGQAEA